MYMYLSDRIRRMFLSGACPQNLSPKNPLSLKDQRFLQKTRVASTSNLTRMLVKQQRLLYEKHIGHVLQENFFKSNNINGSSNPLAFFKGEKNSEKNPSPWENTPVYLQVCSKLDKTIKTLKRPYPIKFTFSDLRPKNILVSQNEKAEGQQNTLEFEESPTVLVDAKEKKGFGGHTFFSFPTKQKLDNYNFNRKSLTLFVQNIKIQKRENPKKAHKKNKKNINVSLLLEKGKNSDICMKPPLYVNGKSQYINCRYLYDHESLKTCIVPQIFKNQKPVSRAKTLLHERKKIALLYGQLSKKDILAISRKARTIPGFYEDNMFTLLESRVDVCVFRAGFSKTIAGARQLIRNGSVLVNGTKISSCKRRAKPGDYFTFTLKGAAGLNAYKYSTLELYHLGLTSNFLTEKIKIKFIRELALKEEFQTRKTKDYRNKFKTLEKSLHLEFLTENQKHSFCHFLYWGFFLYQLYSPKVESSSFFETFCKTYKSRSMRTNLNFKKNIIGGSTDVYFKERKDGQLWSYESQITDTLFPSKYNNVLLKKKEKKEYDLEPEQNIKGKKFQEKNEKRGNVFLNSKKQKNIVILNLYTQLLLKKHQNLKTKDNYQAMFPFRKNIAYNNLWAIWGQKPLHLEISHKTYAFIYMYKPQKVISPVCLDFKL